MTVVARTLASLSPEARTAVWAYTEFAADYENDPRIQREVRLSVLVQLLIAAGGTWGDVVDLIALHEPALQGFLNPWHARTVWGFYTEHFQVRTVKEAAAA